MLLVYIVIRKYCCVTKETQVLYYCIDVTVLTPKPRKPHTCNNMVKSTDYVVTDYAIQND
jgi:hypothetical protein